VGAFDEAAFAEELRDSPDEALAMVADMATATDPKLRDLARALAARLVVELARRGCPAGRGIGTLTSAPLGADGDLDVDASVDELVLPAAIRDPSRLRVRTWKRPSTAWCLVVDRSGSMGGGPLAAAALAAACVAVREPRRYAVIAFSGRERVIKPMGEHRATESVVEELLSLRGHGTTDLAAALAAARRELDAAGATRSVTVLLSDCRHTGESDPTAVASGELVVMAPAADDEEARGFAARVGARIVTIDGPSSIPAAFAAAFD